MQRCTSSHAPLPRHCTARTLQLLALLLATTVGALASGPVLAQAQAPALPAPGAMRNFPEAALRGTLHIDASGQAHINDKAIQMAPGLRIFNPQNALVMRHSVLGQTFTVNYLIEKSTGWLITAWILSKAEVAQPRPGSTDVQRNYQFESDATAR